MIAKRQIYIQKSTCCSKCFFVVIAQLLQTKVTDSIAVADAFNNFPQGSIIIGVLAVFNPVANEIAEDTAEIIVPGIAQEGAGVGEHTDEIA